jgi:hypothetical protein
MRKMIKYQKGYKYQLAQDYHYKSTLIGFSIETAFIRLTNDGIITAKKGYAWDGASGPTIDTKDCLRASLIHDIGYQLMRESKLSTACRPYFDKIFYLILIEDGMNRIRAWIWYKAVSTFAGTKVLAENDRPILEAP